jgi:hypothetical protein
MKQEQANKLKQKQLVGKLAAFLVSRPAHGQAAEVRSTQGPHTYINRMCIVQLAGEGNILVPSLC